MTQKSKKNILVTVLSALITTIFIVLIMTVDVQAIGPDGTSVGLASVNKIFKDTFGYNEIFYKFTNLIGTASILICAILGVCGLVQWIKRKNILKVDKEILALGVLYIIVIFLYFLFTKVALNYRPMIVPGETELEPSFPSSHTMLAATVFGGLIVVSGRYIKDKKIRATSVFILSVLIAIAAVGRILSGVHWFTDIISGLLITFTLLMIMKTVLWLIEEKQIRNKE